ncbi:MAG: hypothetical protein QOE77_1939 [Blastocatellia bacterium]|nr:hypothetical protein [Blastocatellia bacterium]
MAVSPFTTIKTAKDSFSIIQWLYGWYSKKRWPKAPRGARGIAVAIYTDHSVEREQITFDFIQTLEKFVSTNSLEQQFAVVDIPPHLAQTIKPSNPEGVLEKTRCDFLIYGSARLRDVKKEPTYILDLNSFIRHSAIPIELSKRLAAEMAELLPRRRYISKSDELSGFEVNAASVHLAVQYIIATVAMITGDFEYARQMFKRLQPQLRTTADMPLDIKRSIKVMKDRLPLNITASHVLEASVAHYKWRETRDEALLDEIKVHLDIVSTRGHDFYEAWLLGGIYWFCRHRDVRAALNEISKCRSAKIQNATWLLSEAFLHAYSGRLDRALRLYRTAAKKLDSSVWLEVEEFISWILELEPDKTQLYFCLGVINYVGKGDEGQARKDFETFLRVTPGGDYQVQKEAVEHYLQKLGNRPVQ